MAGTLYELIPGLKEAEYKYKAEQLEGFVGIEPPICGSIHVRPFSPQMYLELEGCGNAFVLHREPTPADAGVFLWRISEKYARMDNKTRDEFIAILSTMSFPEVCLEIHEYRRRAWSGIPQSMGNAESESVGSWVSFVVHKIAINYHWPEQEILNMPFRRLWQYMNRIKEHFNDRYKEQCPDSQRLKNDWLLAQNKKEGA
jgi:hypothetical protein